MLEIIEKSGILIYPIILLSVISLAVFLERMFVLRSSNFIPKVFMEKLKLFVENKSLDEAKALCDIQPCAIGRITKEVLDNLHVPVSRLTEIAEEAGRYEAKKLERFMPTLQTIANISPLLGLLGTVLGMIKTFAVIAQQGVGNAQALSGGISEALFTTAAGLSVAIPTVVFYHIVRHRSESIADEMEKAVSQIVNMIFKEG
jgi:biopolymer transport protein ExbB